jgi:hypothetical protein
MSNILAHMEESALKGMRKAFKVELEELLARIKEAYAEHQKYIVEEMVKSFDIEISEEELKEVTDQFKQLDLDAYVASLDASENVSEEVKSKVSRAKKGKAKAKEESEEDPEPVRGKCKGTTAKGCACKNNAMADSDFCHVHNKGKKVVAKKLESEDEEQPAMTPPPKKTPARRPAAPKKPSKPEHNHDMEESTGECSRCVEHGNPKSEPEASVDDEVAKQLQEIIDTMDDEE